MTGARTAPHILTLVALGGLGALSMNVFLPSLPGMARDFGVEYGVMQLSVSAYLAAAAVVQLLVFRGIAQASSRLVGLLALAAAVEVALISTVLGDTLREVVLTALGTAALLVVLGLVLLRRTHDPTGVLP